MLSAELPTALLLNFIADWFVCLSKTDYKASLKLVMSCRSDS